MFEFEDDKERGCSCFSYKERLSSGKTGHIRVYTGLPKPKEIILVVEYLIYKKRRELNNELKYENISGDGGLEGLIFARDCILVFEEHALKILSPYVEKGYSISILIEGADDKRRRAYRYMERYGYEYKHKWGVYSYLKKIN